MIDWLIKFDNHHHHNNISIFLLKSFQQLLKNIFETSVSYSRVIRDYLTIGHTNLMGQTRREQVDIAAREIIGVSSCLLVDKLQSRVTMAPINCGYLRLLRMVINNNGNDQ